MSSRREILENAERILAGHYLKIDGPYGDMPLRVLDVSDFQIEKAFANGVIQCHDQRTFLGLFDGHQIEAALNPFHTFSFDRDVPGFFWFLTLTCVIASLSEDNSRNFRAKLAKQYGEPLRNRDLSTIAMRWEQLVRWTNARPDSTRQIVLPKDIRNQNIIGYTNFINFPSWRDNDRLQKMLEDQTTLEPTQIIRRIKTFDKLPWSDGFNAAFDDFDKLYADGVRILHDHPFWSNLKQLIDRNETQSTKKKEVSVYASIGFDDEREIFVEIDGTAVAQKNYAELAASLRSLRLSETPLVSCMLEGILPFFRASAGTYECRRATAYVDGMFIVVSGETAVRHGLSHAGNDWIVVDNRENIIEILASQRRRSVDGNGIQAVTVSGGLKVGGDTFIGLPTYLPYFILPEHAHLKLLFPNEGTSLHIQISGTGSSLVAKSRLEGKFRFRVEERGNAVASKVLTFIRRSVEIRAADYKNMPEYWEEDQDFDTSSTETVLEPKVGTECIGDQTFQDFLEALCAKAKTEIKDGQFLDLVKPIEDRFKLRRWDILRMLMEAGWIRRAFRHPYRFHKNFLVQPHISVTKCGLIRLDGAASEIVRERFAAVVTRLGGSISKAQRSPLSIPVISTRSVDIHRVSEDMGLHAATMTMPGIQKFDPDFSKFAETFRPVASRFCWKSGVFMTEGVVEAECRGVALTRKMHETQSDIYEITNPNSEPQRFRSRNASIVMAHLAAGKPMFHFDPNNNLMRRLTIEGYLPMPIAMRMRTLNGVGAFVDAGGFGYAASERDLNDIETNFPGIVSSDTENEVHRSEAFRRRRAWPRARMLEAGDAS